MEFATRLKQLRESKGWTREDLALRLQATYSTIAKYETGVRTPDYNVISKIADAFGVSTDYLLGRTDDPTSPTQQRNKVVRNYPIPPKGYEDLSPEEREEVDRITREFEDFQIQRILKRKRNEKGGS
ncbi:MAG: helix-turn-helix domain-containing protein [Limnochordia bacterium]|nr:helix-turn-helix transcriptional regulator [Clostridiales bacterium]